MLTQTLVCDRGFAGQEFEQRVVSLRARILRPDRRNEPGRSLVAYDH